MINFFFILFLLNFLFFIFEKKISYFINVYDYPDNNRKLHKNKVSLVGGFFFYFNFLAISFFNPVLKLDYFIFIIFSSIFFIIGFYDDKKQINASVKFFILSLILIIFIFFNKKLILGQITVDDYQLNISYPISIFFTTLCILLFINAYNMFDGINLQNFFYTSFILIIFFFKNFDTYLVLSLLIANLFFGFLNLKNRIFLGNSGTLFNGFLISILTIYFYIEKRLFVDEIFVIMMLPGIDMLRLFFQRIFKKKHPFLPDRLHVHHLLMNIYGHRLSIIILQAMCIFPYFFYLLLGYKIIFFFVIFYFFFINFLLRKHT
jgi:UDP-GlcNAc:undecaprenyl-phosphate GlcNAc-1-phosphate transferase